MRTINPNGTTTTTTTNTEIEPLDPLLGANESPADDLATVNELIEAIDTQSITTCIKSNNMDALLVAIDGGSPVNFVLADEDNLSLVYWCATKSKYWMVQQLINRGADLEYNGASGKYKDLTLLQYATKENDAELISILIKANANTKINLNGAETDILKIYFESNKHKINDYDRAFGIRSNDHGIAGSRLQGMYTRDNCLYLLDLLRRIPTDSFCYQAINNIKGNLELISESRATAADTVETYAAKVLEKIDSADKQNSSVAFMSGWVGHGTVSGHAIICELRFINNEMLLMMHNTGAGINLHGNIVGPALNKYASAKVYKFDYVPTNIQLKAILEHILSPKYFTMAALKTDTPTDTFYRRLEFITNYYGGIEQNPNDYNIAIVYGQKSGTCAWKSLLIYIRNGLRSYDEFMQVKYAVKLDTLQQYYNTQITLNRLDVPFVRQQLRFAIENLSRIRIKMQARMSAESLPDFTHGETLIAEIASELANHSSSIIKKPDFSVLPALPNFTSVTAFNHIPVNQDLVSTSSDSILFKKYDFQTGSIESKNLTAALVNLLNVAENDAISSRYRMSYLEQSLIYMNKQDFFSDQSKKDYSSLSQNIDSLFKISAHYTKLAFATDAGVLRLESLYLVLILATCSFKLANTLIGSTIKEKNELIIEGVKKGKKAKKTNPNSSVSSIDEAMKLAADEKPEEDKLTALQEKSTIDKNLLTFITFGLQSDTEVVLLILKRFGHIDTKLVLDIKNLIKTYNRSKSLILSKENTHNPRLDGNITDKTEYLKLLKAAIKPEKGLETDAIYDIILKTMCINASFRKLQDPIGRVDPNGSLTVMLDPTAWFSISGSHLWISNPVINDVEKNTFSIGGAYDRAYYPATSTRVCMAPGALGISDILGNEIKLSRIHLEDSKSSDIGNGLVLNSNHMLIRVDNKVYSTENMSRVAISVHLAYAANGMHKDMQFLISLFNLYKCSDDYTQIISSVYEFIKKYPDKLYLQAIQDLILNEVLSFDSLEVQLEQAQMTIWMLFEELAFLINVANIKTDYNCDVEFILKLAACMLLKIDGLDTRNFDKKEFTKYKKLFSEQMKNYMEKFPNKRGLYRAFVYYLKINISESKKISDQDILSLFKCNFALDTMVVSGNTVSTEPWLEQSMTIDLITANLPAINQYLQRIDNESNSAVKAIISNMLDSKTIKGDMNNLVKLDSYNYQLTVDEDSTKKVFINIMEGSIGNASDTFTLIPGFLLNNDMFKRTFGVSNVSGWISEVNKIFRFAIDKVNYRISYGTKEVEFYRVFTDNGVRKAFKLLERGQTRELPKHLPHSLLDNQHLVWAGNQSWYITTKNTNVVYNITPISTSRVQDKNTMFLMQVNDKSDPFIQNLLRFEDVSFVEIWSSDVVGNQNSAIKIILQRYNLEFNKDAGSDYFIWSQDKRYYLNLLPDQILIGQFNNYLSLLPTKEYSYLNPIVLVPNKYFRYSLTEESMKMDMCNLSQTLETIKKFKGSIHHLQVMRERITFSTSVSNACTYRKIYLDDDLNISAQNEPAALLQLSYVYAAVNDVDIAFEYFNRAKLLFKGTTDERAWLKAIFDLHYVYIALSPAEEITYSKSIIFSAELVALRLQTAVLLAPYDQALKDVVDNNSNDYIVQPRLKSLLAKYNIGYDNIPKKYRLNVNEEIIIQHALGDVEKNNRLKFLKSLFKDSQFDIDASILQTKFEVESSAGSVVKMKSLVKGQYSHISQHLAQLYQISKDKIVVDNLPEHFIDSDYKAMIENVWHMLEYLIKNVHALEQDLRLKLIKSVDVKIRNFGLFLSFTRLLDSSNRNSAPKTFTELSARIYEYTLECLLAILDNPDASLMVELQGFIKDLEQDIKGHDFYKKFDDITSVLNKISAASTIKVQSAKVSYELGKVKPTNTPESLARKPLQQVIVKTDAILSSNLQHTLRLDLKPRIAQDEFVQISTNPDLVQRDLDEDIEYGKYVNENLASIDQSNVALLKSADLLDIQQQTSKICAYYNDKTSELEQRILSLANEGSDDLHISSQIILTSRLKSVVTMQDLILTFIQDSLNKYLELTLLTKEEDIQQLHQLIFDYLCYATIAQQYQKTANIIKNILDCEGAEAKQQLYRDLSLALTTTRNYEADKHLGLLVFEYVDNKILFAEQVKYYMSLAAKNGGNFKNALCQIMMGGGKSKVLLPLLAWLKADGDRLAVHVVTKDLFDTNFKDLSNISNSVFGQKIFRLQYNRHNANGNDYFQKLYYALLDVIRCKNYVLCVAESIQSLELTYLSFIYINEKVGKKSVESTDFKFLEKILVLLKTKADATIDEADEVLSFNSELNYPMGEKFDINHVYPFVINDVVKFYGFLETRFDIINNYLNETQLLDDIAYQKFANDIVEILLQDKTSLFYEILDNITISDDEKISFKSYLIDKSYGPPAVILKKFNDLQKERIAHLRHNLTELLHFTLTKHVNEHFGLRADSKWIAVPYIGANTPSERSEFSSFAEKVNYTIQTHLVQDLDKSLFNKIVEIFKYKYAIFCAKDQNHFSESITNLETEFKNVLGLQIKLIDLDESNTKMFTNLYETAKKHLPAKLFALREIILGNILLYPYTLNSNAQSFNRIFSGCQAFSGTMSGYRALEPRFKLEKDLSRGIDGIAVDLIVKNTEGVVAINNSFDPNIFGTLNIRDFNALIDQGAVFKDFSNKAVALKLVKMLDNQKIKYILYFQNNHLEAISTININHVIKLNSSDVDCIEQALKVSPEEYFCYYDQKHTIGVDILNARTAKALLTFNEHTTLRDMQQAALRMRNLSAGQKLMIAAPAKLAQTINDVNKVIHFVIKNQLAKLEQEHYKSAILQVNAILSSYIRNMMIELPAYDDKHNLFMACSDFIFTYHNNTIFSTHGQKYSKVDSFSDLQRHADTKLTALEVALKKVKRLNANALLSVKSEVQLVLDTIQPVCTHQIYSGLDASQGSQQVNEQEAEMEMITKQDNSQEIKAALEYLDRRHCVLDLDDYIDIEQDERAFFTLREVIDSSGEKIGKYFAENIIASQNFIRKNHKQDVNYMNNKFEVRYIALLHHLKPNTINYFIIGERDFLDLKEFWKRDPVAGYALSIINVYGAVYYADKSIPDAFFKEKRHAEILEQISFFSCALDNIFCKPQWILQNTDEKISFLRKFILNTHAHNPKAVDYFCQRISNSNNIRPEFLYSFQASKIEYIVETPSSKKKRTKKDDVESDEEEVAVNKRAKCESPAAVSKQKRAKNEESEESSSKKKRSRPQSRT